MAQNIKLLKKDRDYQTGQANPNYILSANNPHINNTDLFLKKQEKILTMKNSKSKVSWGSCINITDFRIRNVSKNKERDIT